MVVMDANLTPRAIRSAISLARKAGVPICVDPTSVSLAPRLIPHLAGLAIVTPNVAEAGILCGAKIPGRREAVKAAQKLVAAGVETAIITMGPEGLCYATSTESGHVPAIKVEVVDYTGAGDALTAGMVFGLLNDFPLDEAVRLGVSAATLTIQSRETVRPDLSLELLYERLVI